MVEVISYVTLCTIAALIAYFSNNAPLGAFCSSWIYIVWNWRYGFGTLLSLKALSVYTYFAIAIFAIVGQIGAYLMKEPRILDFGYLRQLYYGLGIQPASDKGGFWRVALISILFIVAYGCSFIIYELEVSSFGEPYGGIVTVIVQVALAFLFYLIIRRESVLFSRKDDNPFVFVVMAVAPYMAYLIAYFIVDFYATNNFFFTKDWNFYISLISAGLILLYYIVASFLYNGAMNTMPEDAINARHQNTKPTVAQMRSPMRP